MCLLRYSSGRVTGTSGDARRETCDCGTGEDPDVASEHCETGVCDGRCCECCEVTGGPKGDLGEALGGEAKPAG